MSNSEGAEGVYKYKSLSSIDPLSHSRRCYVASLTTVDYLGVDRLYYLGKLGLDRLYFGLSLLIYIFQFIYICVSVY